MGGTVSAYQGVSGVVAAESYAGVGAVPVHAHVAESAWGAVPYISWTDETSGDDVDEVQVDVSGVTEPEKRPPGRPRKKG